MQPPSNLGDAAANVGRNQPSNRAATKDVWTNGIITIISTGDTPNGSIIVGRLN